MSSAFPSEAQWITSSPLGGPRTCPPAVYYRRDFHAEPGPATLQITALGVIDVSLNGTIVSDDVFVPGWTEYRRRVQSRSYEIGHLLQPGVNTIGVILGSGWFSGHVAERDRQLYGEMPALLLAITSPSATLVATDTSWRTSIGPILENDLIMGESYDARRELGPWSSPGYNDHAWTPALPFPAPAIEIVPALAPPVRRMEIRPGSPLPRPEPFPWLINRQVFDFGQNLVGRVRFRVRGPRGCHIRIRHAEMLKPDGTLYTENLRSARATDHYTLRGGDVEEWEPRFTFHGFRYAELAWWGEADILGADAVVLHNDCPRTGYFSCSHPLLNQLAENTLWSQKGNFLEVPTDCPQRDERLGWTGDAQAFARTACFFMDVETFFRKWLLDMRDSQGPAGAVPPICPNTGSFGLNEDGGPAWADAAFIVPWTVYQTYGDPAVLAEHYPCMTGYLDFLAQNKVKDGIRPHPDLDSWGGFGDWLALDGSGRTEGGTAKDLIGTAFYAHALDLTARSAEVLGKSPEAARFRALRAEVAAAFARRFLTPDGLVAGGTQTGYVLALHFQLVPDSVRANAARELVRLIERNGWRIGTGFVGTPYILHVLEATGHLDVAYRLLEQEAFPSWLFPVKNGATTIWERWNGWTPEAGFGDPSMNSFNHYAYGCVCDWMVSTVAGLEPAEPGFRSILFKPRPGGSLRSARAELKTRAGHVAIDWNLDGDSLQLQLDVPPGARAILHSPSQFGGGRQEISPGHHSIRLNPA